MPDLTVLVAGLALGVMLTLSPLTPPVLAVLAVVLWRVARTLPRDERWWFVRLFGAAMLLRVAAIAVLFLTAPHDTQASAYLFGDEAYALARSWRFRNVLLGIPQLKYDYTIAFEGYGQSSFISLMTYLQVLAGPAPYGLRVMNAALYVSAIAVLFRLTRRTFGPFCAFAGSVVLLFLPTLFLWSISLLKEAFYLVSMVGVLAAVADLMATRSWRRRAIDAGIVAACLFALRDLRTGAVALAVAGIALGLAGAFVIGRRTRLAVALILIAVATACALFVPSLQQRVIAQVDRAATEHSGHAFTVGHSYKLLDEGYYVSPGMPTYSLRPDEAARYVIRAGVSYLTVPLPWQIATKSELAYLPEQLIWYLLVILGVVGAAEAFRRDLLVGSLLIAYILPTAVAVALTTGNVGTLIRHRTLIAPYLVWISMLGIAALLRRLARSEAP